MDTTGMLRPKTVEGATSNLAVYLINNQPTPDNPMAPAHRDALESLAILGDKLTPRKEKATHHGSGSRHRSSSKDAHDDITQSTIDKAADDALRALASTTTILKKLKSMMVSSMEPIV
jgi:hypothetical protein